MIKILVLKNDRLDTKNSFIKAKNFFKEKGIEVSFFQKEINELVSLHPQITRNGFDSKTGKPTTIHLMALDLATVNNAKKYKTDEYDIVMFAYDSEQVPQKLMSNEAFCSWTKPDFIELVINQYAIDKDEQWITIAHELMHWFCYNLGSKGIIVQDKMDTFYKNNDPFAEDGNFAQTLANIKPYINRLYRNYIPVVTITRKTDTGNETLGELVYEDFKCLTLERAWKDNKSNISCIPKGEYLVKRTFSPKFVKYTYEVQKVPKRSGIRFHSANYWFDLNGCIALGTAYKDLNSDKETDILNSRATIKQFETLLQGKDFKLIIK